MPRRELQRQINDPAEIPFALNWMQDMARRGIQRGAVLVTITRPRRTKDQNSKQWPMLNDIATQKQMVINGELVWATADDWKDVLTAAFSNEVRIAEGLDGAKVLLGLRTSDMRVREFSNWIEFLYATGSDYGIVWSERSRKTITQYASAA